MNILMLFVDYFVPWLMVI